MTILIQSVRRVAEARAQLAEVAALIKERRTAFEASIAHLTESQKELAAAVATSEEGLRAEALATYHATHDRAPAAGVEIKLYKTMRYDPTRALDWAKRTGMCLVPESLDAKAFEKIAKATTIEFVEYDEEPKVTIATDLTKVIAVECVALEGAA